jgi:hypothetical protein
MLTVYKDPQAAMIGDIYALDHSLTIQENIALHVDSGADYTLWLNGRIIDNPAECEEMDRLASVFDVVRLARRQEGIVEVLVYAAIAVVAAIVVVALNPKPDIPNNVGQGKDSPNNKFTGATNQYRLYQAMPDIYGRVVSYPDLIQQSFYEYINNVKFITEWMFVSRGTGDVAVVRSASTPFTDITNATYSIFKPTWSAGQYPEDGTTTVTNIRESFSTPDVNGQKLPPLSTAEALTGIGSCTFSVNNLTMVFSSGDYTSLDQVLGVTGGVRLVFTYNYTSGSSTLSDAFNANCNLSSNTVSGGITTVVFSGVIPSHTPIDTTLSISMRRNNGNKVPTTTFTLPISVSVLQYNFAMLRGLKWNNDAAATVTFNIDYWAVDTNNAEIAGSRGQYQGAFSGNTLDQQFKTIYVSPAFGLARYKTNMTRTNFSGSSNDYDKLQIESINGVRDYASKVFPSSTIIRVTTQATESATSGTERKFNCEFTRWVRDFNTIECSASRNLFRSILHQHTAVARRDIAQLDTATMQRINNSLPSNTTLLNFDFTFDDKDVSYGERIATMANAGRCSVFRDGYKWSFVRDELRGNYPVMQLDYRNLSASGESNITMDRVMPNSFDGIELEYVDVALNKKALIKLHINSDGSIVEGVAGNPSKIKLAGCRDKVQAMNRAYLEAGHLIYSRDGVTDEALSDANMLGRGDLVRWIDPSDFYGDDGLQAGEIISIIGNLVETSEECLFKGQQAGRTAFTGVDGSSSAFVRCVPRTDGVSGFIVDSVPSAVYLKSGDQGLSSRYVFGVGLTDQEIVEAGLYTVINKTPKQDGTIGLQLRKYDKRAYAHD